MSFDELHYCVYRYTDISDWKVKYIGIVNTGNLPNRHRQHRKEAWYQNGIFVCEYIQMNNQSETEAMESHLIAYYHTDKYYNRSKVGWGLNSMLAVPPESKWEIIKDDTTDFVLLKQLNQLKSDFNRGKITRSEFTKRANNLKEISRAILIERNLYQNTQETVS